MALKAAFKRQMEKKKCMVCGSLIPFGVFRRHVNACVSNPDDEDCKVLQILTSEDKKRIAIENAITLNDSASSSEVLQEERKNEKRPVSIAEALENFTQTSSQIVNTSFEEKEGTSVEFKSGSECASHTDEANLFSNTKSSEEKVNVSQSSSEHSVAVASIFRRKRTARITVEETSMQTMKKHTLTKTVSPVSANASTDAVMKVEQRVLTRTSKFRISASASSAPAPASSNTEKDIPHKTLEEIVELMGDYFRSCDCTIRGGSAAVPDADEASEERVEQFTSPYYLVLFNYVLKKVFAANSAEEKRKLISFWGEELCYVHKFVSLTGPSKQLLIRLFLRKRNWLLSERLKYGNIASDLIPLFKELVKAGFVDSSDRHAFELEDALRLLQAPSLKVVAKQFKIDFSLAKEEMFQKLLIVSKQKNVFGLPCAAQMLKTVKKELKYCYRLQEDVAKFMTAIFTLFSPTDMCSSVLLDQPATNLASQLLFMMLELKLGKIRYAAPPSPPLFNIYDNITQLYSYVEAKLLEGEIAYLMMRGQWNEVLQLATKAREKFEEKFDNNRRFCESLPHHLRRFTDCWVYTRCIGHGIEAHQRLRDYEEAVIWLRYLLFTEDFKMFATSARGSWWDRLALNLDSHLRNKIEAFETVQAGVADPALGDKDRLLLQMRGEKLNKMWKGPLKVSAPDRVDINGVVLGKALGDQRTNRFTTRRNGEHYECPVEEVALDHYLLNDGYEEGVHAEGAIWHFVFGLLCYDIIFDYEVPDVWFSETQTHPLDLNTKAFYTTRKAKFDQRFKEIELSKGKELIERIQPVYEEHFGETNNEMSWEIFKDLEQVKRFLTCCRPKVLTAVFRRVTGDYRNCRSGFPDLTVWNAAIKKLAVVEVKGPGDKLSTKQILWLQYFKQQRVTAHVCHVAAQNPKHMR